MELAAGVFEEGTEPEGPGVVRVRWVALGSAASWVWAPLVGAHRCLGAIPSGCWESVKMRFFPMPTPSWALLSGEKSVQGPEDTAGMPAAALSVPDSVARWEAGIMTITSAFHPCG